MSKPLTSIQSKFRSVFCLVAIGILGCGGEVDSSQGRGAGPTGSGSDTSTGGSQNADSSDPSKLLADCRPGFDPRQATADKPCAFFVGSSCYATQDEACGCACPREKGAVICVADANTYLPGTNAFGVWCEPTSG